MAGILDTFFFLFEADAKSLTDGLREGEKESDKLTKKVGDTDKAATMLGANLNAVVKKAVALGAAFLSYQSIKHLVIEHSQLALQMGYAAQAAHTGVEAFGAYAGAAEASGGSVDGFASSLKALAKYGRDPIETLKSLQGRFEGLSKIQATRLGERFGLDIGTINLLQMGKVKLDEFIARRKELGVVTEEQLAVSKAFDMQLRDTNQIWGDVGRRIAVAVMPFAEKFLKLMENTARFLRDNKTVVLAFFGAIAGAIVAYYLPAMVSAAVATYAALAPFILIGAVIVGVAAAFALLYDDVMAFLAGNNSMIGELSKKWPIIGELVRGFVDVLAVAAEQVKAILGFIVDLITEGPEKAFANFGKNAGKVFEELAKRFPNVAAMLNDAGKSFAALGKNIADVWGVIIDMITKAVGAVSNFTGITKDTLMEVGRFFGLVPDEGEYPTGEGLHGAGEIPTVPAETRAAVQSGQQELQAIQRNPLASQTSNSISNSVRSNSRTTAVQIDKVEVNTQASDGGAVSAAISDGLSSQIKGAIDQDDDGLAA